MREIKFRVWNKYTKRFESKGYLTSSYEKDKSYVLRGVMEHEQDEEDYCDDGESVNLEQFTGLKDKNGVKIYEGDITNYGIVVFKNGCFGIVDEHKDFISFNDVNLYFYQIIGNIHQNPELL